MNICKLGLQATILISCHIVSQVIYAADVNGTENNDNLFFNGTTTAVNRVITNPYSGDTITLSGNFVTSTLSYDGLGGTDTLVLTSASDLLFLEDPVGTQLLWNIERFLSGSGADVIDLTSATITLGDTFVRTGASDDIIWSNVGNDLLVADDGDDRINGGPGNDTIYGGAGNDNIRAGMGNDNVLGESGLDTVDLGPGEDIYSAASDNLTDLIGGGTGNDAVDLPWYASQVSITPSSNPNYQLDITTLSNGVTELRVRDIEIANMIDGPLDLTSLLASQVTCHGFFAPFTQNLNLKNNSKKTIPVKIQLSTENGSIISDQQIQAPPVINVTFSGTVFGSTPSDNEDLLSNGAANDGNAFQYDPNSEQWIYLLGTKQFTQSGVYEVTVKSGDNTKYAIMPSGTCEQTFTRMQ